MVFGTNHAANCGLTFRNHYEFHLFGVNNITPLTAVTTPISPLVSDCYLFAFLARPKCCNLALSGD